MRRTVLLIPLLLVLSGCGLTKVVTVLGTTAFSLFSALQHDVGKVREGMAHGTRYVTAVCFPLTAGVAISAPLLIPVVFGDRWSGATRIWMILRKSTSIRSISGSTDSAGRSVMSPTSSCGSRRCSCLTPCRW